MSRVRIKICGVTTPDDAAFAIDTGADAVGLNFHPGSPRYLTLEQAERIMGGLPPFAAVVGVYVKATVLDVAEQARHLGLSAVQTYQEMGPSQNFRPAAHVPAYRVHDAGDLDAIRQAVARYRPAAVLIDSFVAGEMGGTGHRAPWHLLAGFDPGVPVILAGGLTPDNVVEAIRVVRPWGVDVASGVELAPGRKDPVKVAAFVRAVRAAGS